MVEPLEGDGAALEIRCSRFIFDHDGEAYDMTTGFQLSRLPLHSFFFLFFFSSFSLFARCTRTYLPCTNLTRAHTLDRGLGKFSYRATPAGELHQRVLRVTNTIDSPPRTGGTAPNLSRCRDNDDGPGRRNYGFGRRNRRTLFFHLCFLGASYSFGCQAEGVGSDTGDGKQVKKLV